MTTKKEIKHPLILKLDITGEPRRWLSYQDATISFWNAKSKWQLGEPIRLYGGTCAISGEQSFLDLPAIIAVDNGTSIRRKEPRVTARGLFRRDLGICAYCGNTVKSHAATKDHILPVSKGGKDTWKNLVLSCRGCNGKKSDRTPEQAGMKLRYKPYVPTMAEIMLYENSNTTPDQLEYLEARISTFSRYFELKEQRAAHK